MDGKSGERGIENQNPPEFDGVEDLSFFKTLFCPHLVQEALRDLPSSFHPTPSQAPHTLGPLPSSPSPGCVVTDSLISLPSSGLVPLQQGLCLIPQLLALSKRRVDALEMCVNAGT